MIRSRLLAAALFIGLYPLSPIPYPNAAFADTTEDVLFSLINAERAKAGVPPLTRNASLDSLATEWAGVMAKENVQRHRPLSKALLNDHGWKNLSENIYGPTQDGSARAIVSAWMGSSGHRENLLRNSSTLGGVGIAQTKSGAICAVFNGAQPAPSPAATTATQSSQDSDVAFPGLGMPDFVPKAMRDPAAALPSNSDGRKLNQLGRTNL